MSPLMLTESGWVLVNASERLSMVKVLTGSSFEELNESFM